MAELTTRERLQPSLLDRLTDDDPQSSAESRDRRVMSMRQLRNAVLRDLGWLLNAGCRPEGDEIYAYPRVAASVLNYGLPDLAGTTESSGKAARLDQAVYDAVLAFEPRIVRSSLEVRAALATEGGMNNRVQFEILGELCPLPMPEALFVRTEVDLETGRCEIRERG